MTQNRKLVDAAGRNLIVVLTCSSQLNVTQWSHEGLYTKQQYIYGCELRKTFFLLDLVFNLLTTQTVYQYT